MNADSILSRLSQSQAPSVDRKELEALVSHINYLEKVCGSLLGALTEAKVEGVHVPAKETFLRAHRGQENVSKTG